MCIRDSALAEADLEGFVVIDGTQVPLKRYDVTLKLVELGTIEGPMSFDDLLESFVAVLDGAGVPLDATIRPDSPRAYSAWLVRQDGITVSYTHLSLRTSSRSRTPEGT